MPKIYVKQLRVGADSIDVMGHVNNQEYLRWMEEIAIEHSTAQGWPMERYLNSGASWYVRSHFIEYLRPALLGDEITICTWLAGMTERVSPRRTVFLRNASRRQFWRARRPSSPSWICSAGVRCPYLTQCDRLSRSSSWRTMKSCGRRACCRTPARILPPSSSRGGLAARGRPEAKSVTCIWIASLRSQ